ncbi:indolepyruvate oxidoreductase subunit beta [Thermodesulfobacteriota bacterium]
MPPKSHCKIAFVGVGGQGVLLASGILGDSLMKEGYNVISNEIHGMAKRGGVVELSLVFGERQGGRIDSGGADILVAFEPLEGYRALCKCSSNTIALVNRAPLVPPSAILGSVPYPEVDSMIMEISQSVKRTFSIDAREIAMSVGSEKSTNIVMLGALCGIEVIPCSTTTIQECLAARLPAKLYEINHKAFLDGAKAVRDRSNNQPQDLRDEALFDITNGVMP